MKRLSELYKIGEEKGINPNDVKNDLIVDEGFYLEIGQMILTKDNHMTRERYIIQVDKEISFKYLLKLVVEVPENAENTFIAVCVIPSEKETSAKK